MWGWWFWAWRPGDVGTARTPVAIIETACGAPAPSTVGVWPSTAEGPGGCWIPGARSKCPKKLWNIFPGVSTTRQRGTAAAWCVRGCGPSPTPFLQVRGSIKLINKNFTERYYKVDIFCLGIIAAFRFIFIIWIFSLSKTQFRYVDIHWQNNNLVTCTWI